MKILDQRQVIDTLKQAEDLIYKIDPVFAIPLLSNREILLESNTKAFFQYVKLNQAISKRRLDDLNPPPSGS